jgi:hypothetical protein
MNEHIRRGNDALKTGDLETAKTEFYEALADPDALTQRIARNRLIELFPESVFASTHSFQQLYHRPNCSAKNIIVAKHIMWFRDWQEAESTGRKPCSVCKPPRLVPKRGGRQ